VNLLGPIAFFLLAWQLLGRWPAVAALGAYLFLGKPDVPSWFQATYSPWAWPMDFAQGFFYLTAAAYVRAAHTRKLHLEVLAGVLLGVTFLAHTAPTLVFVGALFLLTFFSDGQDRLLAVRRLVVVGCVSLLVASPFLGPLLLYYRLQVLNKAPSEHAPIGAGFVLQNLFTFRAALAGLGLLLLLARRAPDPKAGQANGGRDVALRRRILLALAAAPALLFGYGLLAQGLQNRGLAHLPRVLPTYHFHLYLKAAESLLFGLGLAAAARFLARLWWPARDARQRVEGALLAGLLLAAVAAHLPGYLKGIELARVRCVSERIASEMDRIAVYRWLLAETDSTDVFRADQETSFWAVDAADRKVVSLEDQYSNIYVCYEERADDQEAIFASLRTDDRATFDALADKYQVTHIILTDKRGSEAATVPADRPSPGRLTLVWQQGAYCVYRRY
jgi:hypothetical protein